MDTGRHAAEDRAAPSARPTVPNDGRPSSPVIRPPSTGSVAASGRVSRRDAGSGINVGVPVRDEIAVPGYSTATPGVCSPWTLSRTSAPPSRRPRRARSRPCLAPLPRAPCGCSGAAGPRVRARARRLPAGIPAARFPEPVCGFEPLLCAIGLPARQRR